MKSITQELRQTGAEKSQNKPVNKPAVKPATRVDTAKTQTRSALLDFMRKWIGCVLPEATIAEIAATFSEAAVKQISNELRKAVEQRPQIVTAIGKLLMPSKEAKISAVGTKTAESFLILAEEIPTGIGVKFSNKKPPFNYFVLMKNETAVFGGNLADFRQFVATRRKTSAQRK